MSPRLSPSSNGAAAPPAAGISHESCSQLYALFAEAVQLELGERDSFLERACGGNSILRAQVEELLAQDVRASRDGFLETPRPSNWPSAIPARDAEAALVGRRIGPYVLQQWIASGGMGAVYRASRVVGYRQEVAIKLMRNAFWSEEFSQRFSTERQVLATLNHPNIARLLDGGATAENCPYLVMEYIDGQPIHRFCDQEQKSVAERVRLLQAVCDAVQYAHERGVLHRDLKPANIVVNADCTPKLTDFGLAKQLGEDSSQTQTGQILGTPSYMAPEQAAGRTAAIGPATDVYALGAILYELLTGRPPFKGATLAETIEQVGAKDALPPRRLQPGLPRDLETICMKCLEKEPARRYASAKALADDLRRFGAGVPIRARPVGRLERTWRWCQRSPLVASLTAALVLAMMSGFAGVTTLWLTAEARGDLARRKQAEAEEQRQKADDHFDLAWKFVRQYYVHALKHPDVKHVEDPVLLRQAVEHYQALLDQQPDAAKATDLRDKLGYTHWLLLCQHRASGDKTAAADAARNMLVQHELVAKENPDSPYYQMRCAVALEEVAVHDDKSPNARSLLDAATAVRERIARDHPDYVEVPAQLGFSYHNLGYWETKAGRFEESARYYEKARQQRQTCVDKDPKDKGSQERLAETCRDLGEAYSCLERKKDALAAWQQAKQVREQIARDHPGDFANQQMLADLLGDLSKLHRELGQTGDALEARRQACLVLQKFYEKERSRRELRDAQELLAGAHDVLAGELAKLGRSSEAAENQREARRIREQMPVSQTQSPVKDK